jgi:hypothetical protein
VIAVDAALGWGDDAVRALTIRFPIMILGLIAIQGSLTLAGVPADLTGSLTII